ncbi:3-oxosteroid 1-dehydrogenase KsdD (plasmid) [Cupriavidus necator N-1]|uniref:3-oxosteroid 1-dehydrogenase KsdD n=1 Tax=Cupriavidus necator (strain ATCC 43291 / DSM 13513 / CCUG 52238 / LMG 8453 / N-1) TaxID=1042878 RepID=F8GX26_CUPNN|nr:FAD-dependent oxidoreductase [Cupriavidus necator]AEI81896.1 3-oxosteroid 1-dehydrogenase KsdD [Cupriavidus necator N-1]MDX6008223.1 FAD-dependent oxidoreductase [Cupriavidus necator]
MRDTPPSTDTVDCDLLVIGSGAGGLSTAVTARKHGLNVLVVEKDSMFGGTTAFSGGVLWIPGNPVSRRANQKDSRDAARSYLAAEAGAAFDAAAVDAFLENGPKMVEWFERETSVRFVPTLYPDYHPTQIGGVDVGRSILAAPFDIRELGKDMPRLRPPLATITFIGMMFNSSNADLKHFFNVTKSVRSFFYVARRLASHLKELVRYRRGVNVTSGNALAARLAKSALELGIPIWTASPALRLVTRDGAVVGAVVSRDGREVEIRARQGVVLASGGFSHDIERLRKAYPHIARGGEHFSPVPVTNTGDGARLAEQAGGTVPLRYRDAAAWMPVSKVPMRGGRFVAFPHLLDRYKPGVIGVLRNGQRFTNESNSYHDVGADLIRACEGQPETAMWLICDQGTISKYGLGYAKPAPLPLGGLLRKGYLMRGRSLAELAQKCGIDANALEQTVRDFNAGAQHGDDRQFGRGTTSFNRYLGDPEHKPNPCVAPVAQGPFYALKVVMGDLGTFDGIATNVEGAVLREDGVPIEGLYAVGNDRASIMGGNYPGAGITLGPIMTFGYITGRHIARRANVPAGSRALQGTRQEKVHAAR